MRKNDEIQAINGVTLRTRPLSEAIHLLQNSNEAVVLKIRRNTGLTTTSSGNTTGTSGINTKDGTSSLKSSRKTPPSVPKKKGTGLDNDSRRVFKIRRNIFEY